MSFKEDIKLKKDYFMKDYKKEEILKTFNFMLRRMGNMGEVSGIIEDTKITQIDGDIITVEAKMKDNGDVKIYRFSLQFNQMENEEYSREAKIASPERYGNIIELKEPASNKEKQEYYEKVVDYWDSKEEIEKRIEREQKTSSFIERYKKENIEEIVDIMIQNSTASGDVQGRVMDRKILKIEETTVIIAVKTKDETEKIRIYRINLDFNKMNNITYSKEARIASPARVGTTVELQNQISNEEKEIYYERIPDFWNKSKEEEKQEEM